MVFSIRCLLPSLLSVVFIFPKEGLSAAETVEIPAHISEVEDPAIQAQLDHDRQAQKQTKDLKTKLEQIHLELEQEKALAEINKLKMENGTLKEQGSGNDLPEVKVQYIGGSSARKEAILAINGVNFQVKERSMPLDNIQVAAISDSGVTLHFKGPRTLTKTFDYKPE